jgi:HK97 gp10 family phage protein
VGRMKWHGDRAAALIRGEMTKRLHAASILVQNHAKKLVGREGALSEPDRQSNVANRGQTTKSKGLTDGAVRSRPGEPPRKQTGELQRSIQREVNASDQKARVGTNLNDPPYPRWLEFGTRKMAARPWLRRSLDEMRGQIKAIFTRKFRMPDE